MSVLEVGSAVSVVLVGSLLLVGDEEVESVTFGSAAAHVHAGDVICSDRGIAPLSHIACSWHTGLVDYRLLTCRRGELAKRRICSKFFFCKAFFVPLHAHQSIAAFTSGPAYLI